MVPAISLLTLYSDVQPEPVHWLWYPYIAVGKITLLQGDPGDGKSTMMMSIIAELSKGGTAPNGASYEKPRRVIYQCSEDGVADTIKPRLERCGADCENIAFLNEDVHSGLTLDDERIRQAIMDFKPALVVIDPIQAYLGNDADISMATKARKLMHRIGTWASAFDCAFVLIGHLNKHEGKKDLYRGLGSIDVVAAARSVIQVDRLESDDCVRVVHQIKNSLAPLAKEIYFEIKPSSGFRWIDMYQSPESAGSDAPFVSEMPKTKREVAISLMKKLLSDQDMEAKQVLQTLSGYGLGETTVKHAKEALGVFSYRKMRQWYWSLRPRTADQMPASQFAREQY